MKAALFNELVQSVREAGKILRGELKPARVLVYEPIDVKRIRTKLGKSQTEFAMMIGVSVSTLQNWEQGRRKPEGPARALLTVVASNPEVVERALTRRRNAA